MAGLTDDLAALIASEAQARVKTQARTKEGDQDEVAGTKAEIAGGRGATGRRAVGARPDHRLRAGRRHRGQPAAASRPGGARRCRWRR